MRWSFVKYDYSFFFIIKLIKSSTSLSYFCLLFMLLSINQIHQTQFIFFSGLYVLFWNEFVFKWAVCSLHGGLSRSHCSGYVHSSPASETQGGRCLRPSSFWKEEDNQHPLDLSSNLRLSSRYLATNDWQIRLACSLQWHNLAPNWHG